MRRFLEDNLKAKEYEIVRLRAALPGGGGGSSSTDTAAALSGGTTDGSAGDQVCNSLPLTQAWTLAQSTTAGPHLHVVSSTRHVYAHGKQNSLTNA